MRLKVGWKSEDEEMEETEAIIRVETVSWRRKNRVETRKCKCGAKSSVEIQIKLWYKEM